jgi:hypothetical protein
MRNPRRRTAKSHVLAEIIPALETEGTSATVDASLDSDAVTEDEIIDAWANGGDDARGFMTEDEGSEDVKVAVAALGEVVKVAAAETGGDDLYLEVACLRRPDGTMDDTDVAGGVEDSGGDGRYIKRGRHGCDGFGGETMFLYSFTMMSWVRGIYKDFKGIITPDRADRTFAPHPRSGCARK